MIKIGIIDSGIDETYCNGKIDIRGICIKKNDRSNEISFCENISDQIGHGNDCFKIISSIISDVSYYIVKIFGKELVTNINILAAAIRACVAENVDIINISAGITSNEIPGLLRAACDDAYDNNIIIVSAQHNQGDRCYPASYPKVISVGATDLAAEELYRFAYNENVEFYTSAAEIFPTNTSWSASTSFACAKMTAYAANILKAKGKITLDQLRDELINNANRQENSKNE